MKKIILVVVLLFAGFYSMHAQIIKPTTEEEYNIGLTGYKMFLQLKVEIKKGYKITDLTTFEYGDRKAELKGLFREGENKPCAVIIIYSNMRGTPEYFCVPTPDADETLWDRFRISLVSGKDLKQEQLQFFGFALAKGMMWFATK